MPTIQLGIVTGVDPKPDRLGVVAKGQGRTSTLLLLGYTKVPTLGSNVAVQIPAVDAGFDLGEVFAVNRDNTQTHVQVRRGPVTSHLRLAPDAPASLEAGQKVAVFIRPALGLKAAPEPPPEPPPEPEPEPESQNTINPAEPEIGPPPIDDVATQLEGL